MKQTLGTVMIAAMLATGAWAADRDSARQAVETAFPTAKSGVKSGLEQFLTTLTNGDTATMGFMGHTVVFAVRDGHVVVETEAQAPAPAPTPSPDGTVVGTEMTGPDGGVMVWVPAGEFMMGSEDGEGDERPVHRVRITRGFWLGKHEVTNAQYRRFCALAGRTFPRESNQGDDHPVAHVRWPDAKAYCDHYGLILPTEAQWEYAARGPEGREYPWGSDWDAKKACFDGNTGPGGRTFPVGSFPAGASWCGALDMAGNVYEWCSDLYDREYYGRSPVDDPDGSGGGPFHLLRGGAWSLDLAYCRSANRNFYFYPADTADFAGFRCCKIR